VLGIVLELLVVEKKLFAGGENKLGAAIDALQNLIRIFHGRLPEEGKCFEIGHGPEQLAGSFPCLRAAINLKSTSRCNLNGVNASCPACREGLDNNTIQSTRNRREALRGSNSKWEADCRR
jgi:hypothetical protein